MNPKYLKSKKVQVKMHLNVHVYLAFKCPFLAIKCPF